jgi:hypothetical protein
MGSKSAAIRTRNSIDTDLFNNFFAMQSTEQERLLVILLKTATHFFRAFRSYFQDIQDPRDAAKTQYDMAALAFAGVLMFLLRVQSRRQIGWLMRTKAAIESFKALFEVAGVPHGDTLNRALRRSDPWDFQKTVCEMHRRLIVGKSLDQYRLLGKYFVLAIDGTGILSFRKRHCKHCMTRKSKSKTTYYHSVLEAKLVTPNGMGFSMMTQFIENPVPNPKKQDCELKAFYRLAKNLKTVFPRLPIVLSLDGLFARGPVFSLCRENGWGFMIVLPDDVLRSVNDEFGSLSALQPENRLTFITGRDRSIRQEYRWVEGIAYTDTAKREHCLNVIECLETKPDKHGDSAATKFKWCTNMKVTKSTVVALAHEAGRCRWTIEENFNVQKNGGYELQHSYTMDYTAAKALYYLLQIAHTIAQLISKGSLFRKSFPKGLGSDKNLALCLLEAIRNKPVTKDLINALARWRIQIRFCPDTS